MVYDIHDAIKNYIYYYTASQAAKAKADFSMAEHLRLLQGAQDKWRVIARMRDARSINKGVYVLADGRCLTIGDGDYPEPNHIINTILNDGREYTRVPT